MTSLQSFTDLPYAVERLAYNRSVEADYRQEITEIEAEIAESPAGKRLARVHELLKVAQADVSDSEEHVRKSALNQYVEHPEDRHPHPAVEIKMCTLLIYDEAEAIDYCREHLPKALKLDRRAFEKVAKVAGPECVTIGEEPRAYIAKDLNKWLTKEDEHTSS